MVTKILYRRNKLKQLKLFSQLFSEFEFEERIHERSQRSEAKKNSYKDNLLPEAKFENVHVLELCFFTILSFAIEIYIW